MTAMDGNRGNDSLVEPLTEAFAFLSSLSTDSSRVGWHFENSRRSRTLPWWADPRERTTRQRRDGGHVQQQRSYRRWHWTGHGSPG